MERLHSMILLTVAVSALSLVLVPGIGVAEEGASAAQEYEWRSCDEDKVRFAIPKGWSLTSEEVADGVTVCSLPGKGELEGGQINFQHWSKWPVAVGVQPAEYAVTALQKLSGMGRVVDQYKGARGASLVYRIEVVTTVEDDEMHKLVLFVAHSEKGTLDMVTAEWPEGRWEAALEVVGPTLSSLAFADQE